MGCSGCSTDTGKPKGCRSNGGCGTGGCNKLNTFDWLSTMELHDPTEDNLVEVSFRNGAHKSFFRLQDITQAETGDDVVVEADGGYDIGRISLKGALVPIQMKKKSVDPGASLRSVIRLANQNDMSRLDQAISQNKGALVKSRAIAASLGLDMKIGDVDYRADMKKATFYYTADGRVDFRELIRHYAKEFRVKIEMRQIGSRQESSRIGGLGSCGRELCCSTWLTDFKSVTTSAARYQNLAINQAKLSGQCGRLKCCLNYELDVYMEALESFPTNADVLKYASGQLKLIKTDIFKRLMFYIKKDEKGRETFLTLTVDDVLDLQQQIAKGNIPEDIVSSKVEYIEEIDSIKSEDLTGHIELPDEKRKKKKKNKKQGDRSRREDQSVKGSKPDAGQKNINQKSEFTNQGSEGKDKGEKNKGRFDKRNNRDQKVEDRAADGKNRSQNQIRQKEKPDAGGPQQGNSQDRNNRNKNRDRNKHHKNRNSSGQKKGNDNQNTPPPNN
ncbi:MAG: hypothetical protein J5I59_07935 [Saprospiraceae bacterium]|nr:hypothetical protein [Saprospiraceae bacterium]